MVTSSTQTPPHIWKLIFLSSLIPFFIVFPEPALPQLAGQFGSSLSTTQWLVVSCSLAYGVGALLYAPITNRFGKSMALRSLMLCGFVGSVLSLLGVVIKVFSLAVVGRCLLGLGTGSGLVISMVVLHHSYCPKTARILYSCVVPFFMFAPALSLACSGLVLVHLGIMPIFLIMVILSGAGCLITLSVSEPYNFNQVPLNLFKLIAQYCAELYSYYFIQLLCILTITMSSIYVFNAMSTLIAENNLHIAPHHYGLLVCIPSSGLFVGAILSILLNKLLHQASIIRIGLSISLLSSCVLYGLVFYSNSLWGLILPAIGIFLAASIVISNASMYMLQISKNSAIASSLFSSLGLIFASLLVLLMTRWLSFGPIVLPIVITSTIGFALLLSFFPMK